MIKEYSVSAFKNKYPEYFSCFPKELRQDLETNKEYIFRVNDKPFQVEFGFRSDEWILKPNGNLQNECCKLDILGGVLVISTEYN